MTTAYKREYNRLWRQRDRANYVKMHPAIRRNRACWRLTPEGKALARWLRWERNAMRTT